jgi:glycerate kinase
MAMLQARLVNGIDYFLELTGFEQIVQSAGIVITGEGSLDEQTLSGKAPVGVARAAKRYGKPVIALAGKVPLELSAEWYRYFDAVFPINHELSTPAEALQKAAANLSRTACQVANLLGGEGYKA